MKIEIKSWITGSILFEGDFSCIAAAVTEAVKRRVSLHGADLTRADLTRADLTRADLTDADLTRAVLTDADLTRAVLTRADLTDADLREIFDALPTLDNPDAQIIATIERGEGALEMGAWHSCNTTHCRAGWYVHKSGAAGRMLEAVYGPGTAGALIFAKAYPGRKIPNFYAGNTDALADIKANAAK